MNMIAANVYDFLRESQLSQRDRATLCVVWNLAKLILGGTAVCEIIVSLCDNCQRSYTWNVLSRSSE